MSTSESIDYLQIKHKVKSDWMTVSEFYESFSSKNPLYTFTHKNMKNYDYRYRGKKYKYTDLENTEAYQLCLPRFYSSEVYKKMLTCVSKKEGYCYQLLDTLDRYIQKARYETIKAATIFDIDYLNSGVNPKTYTWYYLQRCFYAENAIYSYYSVYEIIVLLIGINRGILDKHIDSFEKICKAGKSHIIRQSLKKRNGNVRDNYKNKRLFELISEPDAKIKSEFSKITDWCNAFKHRGYLRFDGEKRLHNIGDFFSSSIVLNIPKEQIGPDLGCNGDWNYSYINLDDEVIPELIAYHANIIKLANEVIQICFTEEE